jgi:hypothetical protein
MLRGTTARTRPVAPVRMRCILVANTKMNGCFYRILMGLNVDDVQPYQPGRPSPYYPHRFPVCFMRQTRWYCGHVAVYLQYQNIYSTRRMLVLPTGVSTCYSDKRRPGYQFMIANQARDPHWQPTDSLLGRYRGQTVYQETTQ